MGPDRLGDGYKVYKQNLWRIWAGGKSQYFFQIVEISGAYRGMNFFYTAKL